MFNLSVFASILCASAALNGVTTIAPTAQSSFCKASTGSGEATGQQQKNGGNVCVSTVQGVIPDVNVMVSTIITSPTSDTIDPKLGFTITFQTNNLMSDYSVDLNSQFMMVPQTVDPGNGMIQGFQQIVIQKVGKKGEALFPTQQKFFRSFNTPSDVKSDANGVTKYSVVIPAGQIDSIGLHRICTISAAASGQPLLMPVAQRGAQDDCIRIKFL